MQKIILIAFLVFGFFAFTGDIFAQQIYKWVDEKGTVHFSDNSSSPTLNQKKEPPKENGIEVLKRSETGNRSKATTSGGKKTIIDYSQGSSGGSARGSTTIIRSGR